MSNRNNVALLLVEDDTVDIMMFKRAVKKRNLNYVIDVATDGRAALDQLRDPKRSQATSPVILLDLNMPGMNGHEFLEELRNDDSLRHCIVFVLTTSGHVRDKTLAYNKNVAGYFLKSNLDGIVAMLEQYSTYVELPVAGGIQPV